MPRVLSQDLRERVVAAVDGGMSCRGAAERLGSARRARSDGGSWRCVMARRPQSRRAATAARRGLRITPPSF